MARRAWVLVLIAGRPTPAGAALITGMATCLLPLLAIPLGRRIFGLQLPPAGVMLAVAGMVVAAITALTLWCRFGPAPS